MGAKSQAVGVAETFRGANDGGDNHDSCELVIVAMDKLGAESRADARMHDLRRQEPSKR